MKDGMAEIELHEFPFRQRQLQIMAQDIQLFRSAKVGRCAEIIGHNEAAPSNVLAEVCDLFVVQSQEPRLRQIEERVLENFRSVEMDDLVRVRGNSHAG